MPHSPLAKIGLPLLGAFIYSLIAIAYKRLAQNGLGPWRLTFTTNVGQAIAILPLWFVGHSQPDTALLWQPTVTALSFLLGQVALFLAMDRGDVSAVTPLLGSKVILVAALAAALFHQPIRLKLWIAAILATAATALLGISKPVDRKRLHSSIFWGTLAAFAFSLTDIFYEQWSRNLDVWRFSVLVFSIMALCSLPLLPLLETIPNHAKRSFLPTMTALSLVLGGQIVLVAYSIAEVSGATLTNILYSSRGLLSVIIIWTFGAHLKLHEAESGKAHLPIRLIASLIMLAAIVIGSSS
jgi:drug/metabolite transporter (DMT)-like permease